MAPLKFRAWHNGKMYTSFRYENVCGVSYVCGSLEGNHDVCYEVDGKNTVVMQSTGLLDRNEKEIFEGDIVRHHKHWSDGREVSVVEWDAEAAQFFPFGTSDWSIDGKETEVIGNIHQRPDLLTSPL